MPRIEFKLPKGAILFSDDAFAYEFREDLGEAHHGLSLFVARRRAGDGRILGKVLLKAVGAPTGPEGGRVKRARTKLEEQVRLATYLKHPAILRVHGLHKAEGAWYVITEHPTGNNLNDLLTIVSECRRWFSPLFALYVGAQVASALEHAHAATDEHGQPLGIVHRAIDLEHVFMDWNGGVQVADFGLSISNLPGRVVSTTARPQGPVHSTSPETLLTGRVDARSDLYSLGLVMLELATGKNLLDAPDGVPDAVKAKLSRRQLQQVRRALKRARLSGWGPGSEAAIWRAATYTPEDVDAATANLPEALRLPLRKVLQRKPAERFQSASELAAALRECLGGAYGKREAAAEIRRAYDEAGQALVELELRTSRPDARTQAEASA
ncbi:protein kinase [Myxococcus sp. RHSTA-1-4]|uniref:serine/threonine protein kinase n=1 Tax=Myxococcus sp. RHSTA-1-4 TaxID=2874601 RepID=UPI001CBAB84D|nr:protein kinase [Myxococcus sp. RHSTA-1-4]MBZ4422447.1 protein kinase [Myxococcus sp. RHSTA-1-4]